MSRHPFIRSGVLRFRWFTFLLLALILVNSLVQFSSFSLIQNHLVSYYGVEPEDISMSIMVMYAGILTFLPVQFRLQRYFTLRSYLMGALAAGIVLNLGSFMTHSLAVFFVLRFFQGVVVAMVVGSMLMQIFTILPREQSGVIGSSLLFTGILTSSALIGILSSWVAVNMDWNYTYFGLIFLQVLALLLCYFLFHPSLKQRAYPLYQLDWAGTVFFACFSLSLAYIFIYGPKSYWFDDPGMVKMGMFSLIMLLFFLYRQLSLKRPLIDLRAFRYGKFLLGLALLLLFYGAKDTINLIYGYSGGVLGWSATDVVELALCNCAGVIIAIGVAAKLILKDRRNVPRLMLAGFFTMIGYNLWMYRYLTPNLSFGDLVLPVSLQGVGAGLIFLPVMLLTMSSIPAFTGMTGIIVCAYARFIAALNSLCGFYTLRQHYSQEYRQAFVSFLTPENQNLMERSSQYRNLFLSKGYAPGQAQSLSTGLIEKATGLQSQLLTNRVIFLIAAALMALAIVVILLFTLGGKIAASRKSKGQVPD